MSLQYCIQNTNGGRGWGAWRLFHPPSLRAGPSHVILEPIPLPTIRCHPGPCARDPIHVDACCGDRWCHVRRRRIAHLFLLREPMGPGHKARDDTEFFGNRRDSSRNMRLASPCGRVEKGKGRRFPGGLLFSVKPCLNARRAGPCRRRRNPRRNSRRRLRGHR